MEIGLSVVVDRGRGSTTTNHEGLMMRVTCDTKQVNKIIRTELVVVQRSEKMTATSEILWGLLVLFVVMKIELIL